MQLHKMFTLDDLYDFYSSKNESCVFNSQDQQSVIVVQVPEHMKFSDEYDPQFNLLKTHLMSCHLLENRNRSSISEKAMKEAIPSFYNRPILGYIQKIEDEDGNVSYDFAGHEMKIDENGELEYEEAIIGVIPESCNPQLVYNEEHDKTYLEVDGFIYEDYTKAAEILRDKGECDVSIEIAVNSLSYDAKSKIMNIDSFNFLGVTILGVTRDEFHDEIAPGMEGANIKISDFSAENNSIVFNMKDVIEEITAEVMSRLDDKLADNSPYNYGKEEKVTDMDNENVNVEFEEETEEEEVKPVETESAESEEEEVAEKETVDETAEDAPEVVDNFDDDDPVPDDDEPTENSDSEGEDEHQSVSAIEDEDSTGTLKVENSLNYSVTVDGVTKNFAVSLADKINAISTLVNDTYGEADNTFYWVDVYEDDGKYVVMHDFWSDRHFRQEYSVKKDVYSLKGDRIQVYAQYLSADEINKLDKMKSDYSAIESELNTYKSKELHSAREAVIASEDYAVLKNDKDFKELKENMDNFSVEELSNKADLIFAKYMKSHKNSSANTGKEFSTRTVFMNNGANESSEARLPYGGLFKNFKKKNN